VRHITPCGADRIWLQRRVANAEILLIDGYAGGGLYKKTIGSGRGIYGVRGGVNRVGVPRFITSIGDSTL
jgi:hypothetical protein